MNNNITILETNKELTERNLSNVIKKLPSGFVVRNGKILKDLKSICRFVGVDYIG